MTMLPEFSVSVRGLQKGGSRAPQDPPGYALARDRLPWASLALWYSQQETGRKSERCLPLGNAKQIPFLRLRSSKGGFTSTLERVCNNQTNIIYFWQVSLWSLTLFFHLFQHKCCGGLSYASWNTTLWKQMPENENLSVPESCCKTMTPFCGKRDHPSNIYHLVWSFFLWIGTISTDVIKNSWELMAEEERSLLTSCVSHFRTWLFLK